MINLERILKNKPLLKKIHDYFFSGFKSKNKNHYSSKKPTITIQSSDEVFIDKLYRVLDNNIHEENLKAGNISKELHMSHSSMYKKIKLITGKSYVQFIREYRLSLAKELLENKGYSVADTCYMVGYSDRKYFSKLFKIHHGKNPSFYYKKKSSTNVELSHFIL